MTHMKYTTRNGSPLGDSKLESSRKKTWIENAARDAARMYQATVPQKGKEVVEKWEEKLKVERESKDKNKVAQEVDWIIDTRKTHTRETLQLAPKRWHGIQRC